MTSEIRIRDLVSISSADLTEVNIKRDFDDDHKIEAYLPNRASRRTMENIIPGLMPTSTKRVHLLTGIYGTGKSHFGLVLAALLRKHPKADAVLAKVQEKDKRISQLVQRHLDASRKFLIVVPDAFLYQTGFNRALLVALQEALQRESISFRPRSYYEVAIETIAGWKERGDADPQDSPYEKLRKVLAVRGITPEILRDRLSKCSDEDYEVFEDAHKEITYGAPFHPDASIDPTKLYAQTSEYLRTTGEWEGIWVICDEFGILLKKLAENPKSFESQSIQDFAEYSKRSDENQCHLVIIAHQTLADYASGYRSQEEWEKISGRFLGHEHSLENVGARHENVEMISTIITRRTQTDQQKTAWQEIETHSDLSILIDDLQNAGLYSEQERDWLQNTLITGSFPLHPFATFCLPWLAQRVGQRERTLFTFFNDPSEGGFRAFVDNTQLLDDNGRLSFYTPDRLLDYFGPAAESKAPYRQTMRARQEALAQVGDSPLAQRIIDTLSILEIVGSDNLQPIEANIVTALHLSATDHTQVAGLLVELSQLRIIRRRVTGFFELRRRRGEFDLQEVIQEAKEKLRATFSSFDALADMDIVESRLLPIQASSYEKNHFVKRSAARELAVPASLSNPKAFLDRIESWYEPNRKEYGGDVLVLYILAEDVDEIEQAKEYAAMKACWHPQLVLAIPKEPVLLTEMLLELSATEQVRERLLTEPNKEEADIEELEQMIADEQAILGNRLDGLLQADNLIWYCNGDSTTSMKKGGEEEYISNLLEAQFSKTPIVRDSAVANILKGRDSQKKHRHEAMTQVLAQKGSITIKKTGGTAANRILRNCLRDTEVLKKKEDRGAYEDFEVRIKLPEGADLKDVWQELRDELVRPQQRVEMGKVIRILLYPPYGLSHQFIEILLSAFFRNCLDEFVIFGNYQRSKQRQDPKQLRKINLDAAAITSIVSNPDDYVSFYYEVYPTERKYVNRLIELVVEKAEEAGEMGIWERGRDALLSWFTTLPEISTSSKTYQDDNTKSLVDLLQNQAALPEAKDLFRSRLPEALDHTLSSPISEQEVDQLVDKFEKCYLELVNYADTQALILIKGLVTKFEAEGSTREDLSIAVREWHKSKLSESQRLHTFPGDAGDLKRAIEAGGSIDQRMLLDLPERMGLGPYTSWIETTTSDLFLTKVELAKKEIETWQPQAPPKGGEDDTPPFGSVDRAKAQVKTMLATLGLSDDLQKQVLQELLDELGQ